ncbi:MAG: archaellin/type IV pilin N-terminal domain-containing protein [archaeon]
MVRVNKKGVSEIVSYVLLISITFIIAGMVYSWLTFYVTPGKETKCEEGVSITLRSYVYNCTTKAFNLTLQNRGLFDIDGYIIRVGNQSDSEIGVYTINKTGKILNTSEVYTDVYINSSHLDSLDATNTLQKNMTGNISFIEIQPFEIQESARVFCESVVKQKVVCSR